MGHIDWLAGSTWRSAAILPPLIQCPYAEKTDVANDMERHTDFEPTVRGNPDGEAAVQRNGDIEVRQNLHWKAIKLNDSPECPIIFVNSTIPGRNSLHRVRIS
ncbi:hypothetical protein JOB18_037104 [Solea senegalensis]|uniref:Uncharacterized protein n=1 Tax=Solea senegalensis TaxID=28829 RepID=A0AAV6Q4F5_SOLSE|nr:hypothetical protein JOB18_037104 [Solea senegalensis]